MIQGGAFFIVLISKNVISQIPIKRKSYQMLKHRKIQINSIFLLLIFIFLLSIAHVFSNQHNIKEKVTQVKTNKNVLNIDELVVAFKKLEIVNHARVCLVEIFHSWINLPTTYWFQIPQTIEVSFKVTVFIDNKILEMRKRNSIFDSFH